jgi:2-hydroxychromene-2-carboxylate isomerase
MIDVELYFNYRSPYCYLATHQMWTIEDHHGGRFQWYPLGGWAGRSPPDRAKKKLPLTRMDVRRWTRRLGIPFSPPPKTTDPTRAALAALLAVERGLIRPYTQAVMWAEWAEGRDIGEPSVLLDAAASAGLDRSEVEASFDDPARSATLEANAARADDKGIIGVPTFVIGEEIFWGQDRIDFVVEHLDVLGKAS